MVNRPALPEPWVHAPATLSGALIAVLVAVFGWLLVLLAGWQPAQVGFALAVYAVLAAAVAIAAAWHLNGSAFGLANQVTLLRTGLVCLVVSALLGAGAMVSWSLIGVIGIALALDAVDGWIARRFGLASHFGARFDLEIDALMILILSVLVWQTGRAGPWILVVGSMRYAFVALGMIWPPARRPLPPSMRRKAACALLGVLLLVCLLPSTPLELARGVAALALMGQLASFAIDLAWLRSPAATGPSAEPA